MPLHFVTNTLTNTNIQTFSLRKKKKFVLHIIKYKIRKYTLYCKNHKKNIHFTLIRIYYFEHFITCIILITHAHTLTHTHVCIWCVLVKCNFLELFSYFSSEPEILLNTKMNTIVLYYIIIDYNIHPIYEFERVSGWKMYLES